MTLVEAEGRWCRVIYADFIVPDGEVYLLDFRALLTLGCLRLVYEYQKHSVNSSTFSQIEAA